MFILDLFPEDFYKIINKFSVYLDAYCAKIPLIKLLDVCVILISLIVKLPQILKIWKNQSAQSVSFFSVLANLYSITIKGWYCFLRSYPISSYGELVISGTQTLILSALVLHFQSSTFVASTFVAVFSVLCYIIGCGLIPVDILWFLQAISVPLNFAGRISQGYTIYKEKSTGQLSGVTCLMQFFILTSRAFTSIQETKDKILIFSYSINAIGVAIILMQFIYYSRRNKQMARTLSKSKVT